ncbi:ComF family protein [Ruminococcaceae bacterium OttesenSCG-928-I18]|nr:ComF family protein [Ruminococcaceae bacterium OttesenSCG-928-I18]
MKRHANTEKVLNLLFPKRCPWCDKVLGFAQGCACEEQVRKLRLPDEALDLGGKPGCTGALQSAWACFCYEEPVSTAYHRLKFEDEPHLAEDMGQAMADKYAVCGLAGRYDCILPVPVSRATLRERGYNQSALLGRKVAKEVGLLCEESLLLKVRETEKQMDLGREERLLNVKGAYEVSKTEAAKGKRFLLIDDIITTGSTLNECAKTLKEAGADDCGALALMAVV